MTTDNKTMMQKVVGFPVDEALVEKNLAENELDPQTAYDPNNPKPFDLALAGLYDDLIAQPDFQEGDFQRKLKPQQMAKIRDSILEKYGLKPSQPVIDGTSIM